MNDAGTRAAPTVRGNCDGMSSSDDRTIWDQTQQAYYWIPSSADHSTHLVGRLPMVSLFTGAGGLDLGLEQAGFAVKAFVENDPDCIDTIQHNRSQWPLVGKGDITKLTSREILEVAGLGPGEAALIAGGAPCQPYSSLGKRNGDETANGRLYLHFIRIVRETLPAMFLFENVRGMLQNHRRIIDFMRDAFLETGYRTTLRLLCAADYGVPQKRYRVFIVGRRDGKSPGFPLPTHSDPNSKEQHCLQKLLDDSGFMYKVQLKEWETVGTAFSRLTANHYARPDSFRANLGPPIIKMIEHIKPGTTMCWRDLPDHLKFRCWKETGFGGSDCFGRLQLTRPSVTIRTGAIYPAKGRYIHPTEHRGLDTIEMAVLQSFPVTEPESGWEFKGGITSVARQIGNAVPPLLAYHIGVALRQQIDDMLRLGSYNLPNRCEMTTPC
ncbi:MAG: DNA cytosine methyltransferase [Bacillota bacterium]|jgi:DNA (cytosine-5)-methyltransferase 1